MFNHIDCKKDPHHDLVRMFIEEHYGLHRKSGYMNSMIGHKALCEIKSPNYMRAFAISTKRNHLKSLDKQGLLKPPIFDSNNTPSTNTTIPKSCTITYP